MSSLWTRFTLNKSVMGLAAGLLVSALIVINFSNVASAATYRTGYFGIKHKVTWSGSPGQSSSGHNLMNNYLTNVNTPIDFENKIRACLYNKSGCQSDNGPVSAAFIILTMVGDTTGQGSGSASAAIARAKVIYTNWVSWVDSYAKEDQVEFSNSFKFKRNTMLSSYSNPVDIYAYDASVATADSIVFKDAKGNILYAIKKDCANPVGDLTKLIPLGWSVAGDSYVTKAAGAAGTPGDHLNLNAKPGDTVFFHHDLSLVGAKNDAKIHWDIIGSAMLGKPQAQGDIAVGTSPGKAVDNWHNSYKIPLTDPDGKKYCQSISAKPGKSGSPNNVYKSAQACVTVNKVSAPASGLIPTVTLRVNGSTLVDGGVADPDTKTLDVASGVSNSGAKTADMRWRLYMFKVSNSSKQDASNFSPSSSGDPCSGITSNGNVPQCSAIWSHFEQREYPQTYTCFSGSYTPWIDSLPDKFGNTHHIGGHDKIYTTCDYTQTLCEEKIQFAGGVTGPDYDFDSQYGGGNGFIDKVVSNDKLYISHETRCRTAALRPTSTGNQSVMLSGLTPGVQLCYFTTASTMNGSSNTNSKVKCLLSIAIPFTHIVGNDLRVGSALSISDNRSSLIKGIMKPYGGTSSEYALLAPGLVTGAGSSSGGFSGVPAGQSQNLWSTLTLANESSFGQFAGSQSVGAIPYVSKFLSNGSLKGIDIIKRGGSGFTINSGSDIKSGSGYNLDSFGASAVIVTSGTVIINHDIKYASSVSGSKIPQLIIIANNISIKGNVGQVDAWLVATGGTVDTCSDVADFSDLAFNVCDKPLTINGPIMANRLMLKRTYYNRSSLGVSAETLDMRGDTYLWANNLSRENSQWQTTYTTDLPPRY